MLTGPQSREARSGRVRLGRCEGRDHFSESSFTDKKREKNRRWEGKLSARVGRPDVQRAGFRKVHQRNVDVVKETNGN